MKLNNLGLSGIILLFVSSGMSIIFSFVLLSNGLVIIQMHHGAVVFLSLILLILSILTIVYGALAISKGNNKYKVTCGILGLVSILFAWIWYLGFILALVGGILTLCGKTYSTSEHIDFIDYSEKEESNDII